ncbi:MAG: porphobilinogen synthase [Deltaproteobacteria bacterium]|nr:porphobilinogen synthase [Deltaproteobacteria bacterium]
MSFPTERPRRLRRTPAIREMAAETRIHPSMLIQPHFVVRGKGERQEIPSMPEIARMSPDVLVEQAGHDLQLGIKTVLLFGLADEKDGTGTYGSDSNGPVQQAIRRLKSAFRDDITIITDVCLCAYTDHGHCGLLSQDGEILNDETLEQLSKIAVSHAEAGADMVAPSDMMDGRVGAIRAAMDENGFKNTGIMAYSAKYASAYYGPFRDAAESAPAHGDRKSHQMDVRNRREALREIRLDIEEGADIVMVKPALAYLDVILDVASMVEVPVSCYNVSGEYSMVKAAAANGWIDEPAVVRENLLAMARAGADLIITYHGRKALEGNWLG